MDMVRHFERMFAYDAWANREVLKALQSSDPCPAKSLRWLGHILAAEWLWMTRLQEEDTEVAVWPDLTLGQCQQQIEDLAASWTQCLNGKAESSLTASISYKNSKGEDWSSRIDDVLMHVAMHSTYHRGQIAADMRAAGFTPAYTDFIHAVRKGFVK